jgi:hypothetical protein
MEDGMEGIPHLEGRACGSCSLCCKLMEIAELSKPRGRWCANVRKGSGCAIYGTRPPSCAAFDCGYLIWPEAGAHWFPLKSKMVVVIEDAKRMAIHVDPATPNVWRVPPYYGDIKRWARNAATRGQQIAVVIGLRTIMIFPDGEVDVGDVEDDEIVMTVKLEDGSFTAEKVRADDPRVTCSPRSPG